MTDNRSAGSLYLIRLRVIMLIKIVSLKIFSCIECLFVSNYMPADVLGSVGYNPEQSR